MKFYLLFVAAMLCLGSLSLAQCQGYSNMGVGSSISTQQILGNFYMVRLADVGVATGSNNAHPAMVEIIDGRTNFVIGQMSIEPHSTYTFTLLNGNAIAISVCDTAPGFTLNAKYAYVSVQETTAQQNQAASTQQTSGSGSSGTGSSGASSQPAGQQEPSQIPSQQQEKVAVPLPAPSGQAGPVAGGESQSAPSYGVSASGGNQQPAVSDSQAGQPPAAPDGMQKITGEGQEAPPQPPSEQYDEVSDGLRAVYEQAGKSGKMGSPASATSEADASTTETAGKSEWWTGVIAPLLTFAAIIMIVVVAIIMRPANNEQVEMHRVLSSPTRIDILNELTQNEKIPTDLSLRLGKSKATVIEHLDKLCEAGFVEKVQTPGKKFVYYRITSKGKTAMLRQAA